MKTILVTGGCGFIGSNLVLDMVKKNQFKVINLDKLTYAADKSQLSEVENHPNYTFVQGDICDRQFVNDLFKKYQIDGVMHLAAESHVDNSISNPDVFIQTNVNGTFNLVDAAYKTWMTKPHQYKPEYQGARFLHVSTDEVYGTLGDTGFFTEETPYAPNSPYSASKASSDMIIRAYHHTYGMNTVITNCSNNYGPRQHDEKLIPTVIRSALREKTIPVYGNGKNIRDWLYVLDHAYGIQAAFLKGQSGESYNIGSRNEKQNLDLVHAICKKLDEVRPRNNGQKYADLIQFVTDRPGHDWRYAIDSTKIETQLGWKPEFSFEKALSETINWYMKKYL